MPTEDSAQRLSYKFQRLRERLRDAIASGELAGKLPGERVLARQFHVNAKTLSKALTDLAAEGLLDRTIGRGTFVRGGVTAGGPDERDAAARPGGRWLLICQPARVGDALCRAIGALGGEHETVTDLAALRPSLVNQFSAVVDVHGSLPDAVVRDLLLRSRRLVRVDAPPRTYATHAAMIDRAAATNLLTRELVRNGFRRIVVVDDAPGECFDAARATARRLGDATQVLAARPAEIPGIDGVAPDVAFVGASPEIAADVRARFADVGVRTPADLSIACVGLVDADDARGCSGYAITGEQLAQTIAQLLAEPQLNRPTTLWLVGSYLDRGTVRGDATAAAIAAINRDAR